MKILITGGGSGGHFYPLIAVATEIREIARKEKILDPSIYYMANVPYNEKELFDHDITFIPVMAGKKRVNPKGLEKILNFIDIFKMGIGVFSAIIKIFFLMPDVIFAKGGYVSYPALFAGRLFGIPIILHESDSVPGRVNAWASKFAKRIAVSYKEAAEYFPKDKVAHTGNPVRKDIQEVLTSGAEEYLGLEKNVPVILILGGSQGAKIINDAILLALPVLVDKYQVIHQTGKKHFDEVSGSAGVTLENSQYKYRYRPFAYLNSLALRMAAGVSDLIISRGGSTIFEVALWQIPSIIIPITVSNGDHQRKNAYNYARSGACTVIEEENLTPEIIVNEIERIMSDVKIQERMKEGAGKFARKDSAKLIAEEVLKFAIKHD